MSISCCRPLTRANVRCVLRGSLTRRSSPGDLSLGHHDVQCSDAS
jgi:hypothetical protein